MKERGTRETLRNEKSLPTGTKRDTEEKEKEREIL